MNSTIALVGNPNTGKSTLFNLLTGSSQHIGNWCGATVDAAKGYLKCGRHRAEVVDLPGIYSINPITKDEESTINYLQYNKIDLIVLVLDATGLERSLSLALDFLNKYNNVLICVNLIDEAYRRCIQIDFEKLESLLGSRVAAVSAATGEGVECLKMQMLNYSVRSKGCSLSPDEIYSSTVTNGCDVFDNLDRKIDKIVCGRLTGIPIMAMVMLGIFWLTIKGTNYPSIWLHNLFTQAERALYTITPPFLQGFLIESVFRTLAWIISVMLPPMAIFFPLFTLLEDFGFLPRMAFNADRLFKAVGVGGKNLLTMCMGFGCNAAGVVSARIIDSPKERLIAILTNNFIPCNGRFAGLLILSAVFISAGSGATLIVLTAVILSAVGVYLLVTLLLSRIIRGGEDRGFIMELPPYRKPKLKKIIQRSIKEKILYVLGRAVIAALPAGAVIWLLNAVCIGDVSAMEFIAENLDPAARLMGIDGCILAAFIIGLPANEIVLPIIIMFYTGSAGITEIGSLSEIGAVFAAHGWTVKTAVCTMVLFLNHFPCTTTLLTIHKETGSLGTTAAAFCIPTGVGVLLCCLINLVL